VACAARIQGQPEGGRDGPPRQERRRVQGQPGVYRINGLVIKRRTFLSSIGGAAALNGWAQSSAARKPNIVFILAKRLGL
jgi:hypothetical protein